MTFRIWDAVTEHSDPANRMIAVIRILVFIIQIIKFKISTVMFKLYAIIAISETGSIRVLKHRLLILSDF